MAPFNEMDDHRTPLSTRRLILVMLVIGSAFYCVYTLWVNQHYPDYQSSWMANDQSKPFNYTWKIKPWTFEYTTLTLDPRLPTPPGDLGVPLPKNYSDDRINKLIDDGMRTQGFNQYNSDMISVRRRLPDLRHRWCEAKQELLSDLPSTSVVIVFYNEAWSVLVRTVHSVLDRSPPSLVQEIILVDDCSYLPHTKTQLDDYFRPYPKIRILRSSERLGLMRARLLGARNASAETVTHLDAHVEVNIGWLEALMDRIARNPSTIAIPMMDWIEPLIFSVTSQNSLGLYGGYDWDLDFAWKPRSGRFVQPENPFEPFETPAMVGGLFSIRKDFFAKLGWYDEGFKVYGIENIELSMKSWMCGGRMEIVPCSRVGHVAKYGHPYLREEKTNVVRDNSLRLAEVWMDEYKQIVFDNYGVPGYNETELGEVADRKKLRNDLQCSSFKDYIRNVYPELKLPLEGRFHGEMKNKALGNNTCMEFDRARLKLQMTVCDHRRQGQYWAYNNYYEINSYGSCLDFTGYLLGMYNCHKSYGNQKFEYLPNTGQIMSATHGQCLALSYGGNQSIPIMEPCNATSIFQIWYTEPNDVDLDPFGKKD
ncbi:putative polypeptide N-acetylgalactosaminyltransferase 9 [Malaya genurostris]|uniref:putative polypeptide N-acetylgalactosaminyltransferase 9 n=1 Tax=Malaya genurostris TaxID=325434 RepID=UPI0026F3A6F1|nr:putative polypeptide N-acetylgalactosaminyltransferase 9 [Malaya genurostris]